MGEKKEALVMLQISLSDMESYHFIRVFADEGKAILPILKRIIKKSKNENLLKPNYRYLHEIYLAAYDQSRRHKGYFLYFRAKTCKAFQSAYQKLDVNNAMVAVLRAKELGLID